MIHNNEIIKYIVQKKVYHHLTNDEIVKALLDYDIITPSISPSTSLGAMKVDSNKQMETRSGILVSQVNPGTLIANSQQVTDDGSSAASLTDKKKEEGYATSTSNTHDTGKVSISSADINLTHGDDWLAVPTIDGLPSPEAFEDLNLDLLGISDGMYTYIYICVFISIKN